LDFAHAFGQLQRLVILEIATIESYCRKMAGCNRGLCFVQARGGDFAAQSDGHNPCQRKESDRGTAVGKFSHRWNGVQRRWFATGQCARHLGKICTAAGCGPAVRGEKGHTYFTGKRQKRRLDLPRFRAVSLRLQVHSCGSLIKGTSLSSPGTPKGARL